MANELTPESLKSTLTSFKEELKKEALENQNAKNAQTLEHTRIFMQFYAAILAVFFAILALLGLANYTTMRESRRVVEQEAKKITQESAKASQDSAKASRLVVDSTAALKQANDLVERNKMALAELTDRTNKLKNVAAENQFNTQYLSRAISALTLGQPTIFYGAVPKEKEAGELQGANFGPGKGRVFVRLFKTNLDTLWERWGSNSKTNSGDKTALRDFESVELESDFITQWTDTKIEYALSPSVLTKLRKAPFKLAKETDLFVSYYEFQIQTIKGTKSQLFRTSRFAFIHSETHG